MSGAAEASPSVPKALLIDFGGVLTTNVFDSFRAFCVAEDLPPERFPAILRSDPDAASLFVAVEKGEISEPDFERAFAPMLGPHVSAEGLLRRMTAGIRPEAAMLEAVGELRTGGVVTVLVSNSFGMHAYDGFHLDSRFDHVVVSAHVGTRKPAGSIYRHALAVARCAPSEALFVDDLDQNVVAARRAGLRGYLHASANDTVAALSEIFGRRLLAGNPEDRPGETLCARF
jgi:putative hydrolase of the HAD superfamily